MTLPSEVFDDIYATAKWQRADKETRSGIGSNERATRQLRTWLERVVRTFEIHSLLDGPCGEWGFMQHVDLGNCSYDGWDISEIAVAANRARFPGQRFEVKDLTAAAIPRFDLMLVKDCFQHLPNDSVASALDRFKESRSKYLVTSSDVFPAPLTNEHRDIAVGGWMPENLRAPPFALSGFLGTVALDRKFYAMWRLDGSETAVDRAKLAATTALPAESQLTDAPILPEETIVESTYVTYPTPDRDGRVLLPRGAEVLELGNTFRVPLAAANVLATIGEQATVGELIATSDLPSAEAAHDIGRLLWVTRELGLVSFVTKPAMDVWQRRATAIRLSQPTESDPLSVSKLARRVVDLPKWLREFQHQGSPAEALLAFHGWMLSQGIASSWHYPWSQPGEIHLPLDVRWVVGLKSLVP